MVLNIIKLELIKLMLVHVREKSTLFAVVDLEFEDFRKKIESFEVDLEA